MGFEDLIADANWTTGVASILVGVFSAFLTNRLAWARFQREHRLEDQTEAVLRRMLQDRRFKRRKFETLQSFVPLSTEKLQEALLRAGAVRIMGNDGQEYWGLLENHMDRVFPKA